MILRMILVGTLLVIPGLLVCSSSNYALSQANVASMPLNKLNFDLTTISDAGLIGTNDSLRSLSYEFCIPATESALAEVQAIDATLKYSRSPGRIRCKSTQYLVIGETHKPNWREILTRLAALDYVQRIDQFVGE